MKYFQAFFRKIYQKYGELLFQVRGEKYFPDQPDAGTTDASLALFRMH